MRGPELVESTVELAFGAAVRHATARRPLSGLGTARPLATASWRRYPFAAAAMMDGRDIANARERFVTLLDTCHLYSAIVIDVERFCSPLPFLRFIYVYASV